MPNKVKNLPGPDRVLVEVLQGDRPHDNLSHKNAQKPWRISFLCRFVAHRKRWPICSVPKLPIPFSRKLNTTRFSFRRPTLKVEN